MGPGKKSCCVTTRGRGFWFRSRLRRRFGPSLGRRFGPLAARAFGLGVARFGLLGLAMFGLPLRRLPATDLALTFGLLTVPLIPSPRYVLAAAPFAQADPRSWPPRSSRMRALWLTVKGAHGRQDSQGKSSGRMRQRSPRA
jgi:hypothetical protein